MALDKLTILHEDACLVAVIKPAGLATIPGRAETTSVLQQLAGQIKLPCGGTADPRLRVVHRLDKDTSGVLVFAKTIDAQRQLSHQFQNNTASKEYLAIVHPAPREASGQIQAPLAPDRASPERMRVDKHGRAALTQWQREELFGQFALLRVFPRTGKTHQIRVHLRHAGMPLAVDPLYNPPAPRSEAGLFLSTFKRGYRNGDGEERPLIARLTLHAEKLKLVHPDGRTLEFVAPLPKDFRAALNMLRKYAR